MRQLSILMVFFVGVSFLSFVFAGGMDEETTKFTGNEISELKAEFAELTKKFAELEKKVHQLEARPNAVVGSVPAPDQKMMPKGWRQREFNGLPFYVVPLTDAKSK